MILDAQRQVTNPQGRAALNPALVIGFAVHHTVTDVNGPSAPDELATEAEERTHIVAIDRFHVQQGYGGFGYHYISYPSGRSYLCGFGQRAHVKGRNHELIGFALAGTFTGVQPPDSQMQALRECLLFERANFPNAVIKGHREWALPGEGTACPGLVVPRDWDALLEGDGLTEEERRKLSDRDARVQVDHALSAEVNARWDAERKTVVFYDPRSGETKGSLLVANPVPL